MIYHFVYKRQPLYSIVIQLKSNLFKYALIYYINSQIYLHLIYVLRLVSHHHCFRFVIILRKSAPTIQFLFY
jgi:hypothetical protein